MKNQRIIKFIHKEMEYLEHQSILHFPDEVIEEFMIFLSFSDLCYLSKVEKRLQDCAKRVLKKKPFSKYIDTRY